MAVNKFAFLATLIALGFLSGTYFVEDDMGQSFCLGAFSTGLMGAIVLLTYKKLSALGPIDATLLVTAGALQPAADGWSPQFVPAGFSRFRELIENPTESNVLNYLAAAAVIIAAGFLAGTYVVENELGQSFCLGAFSTGLGGTMLLLGYTKISRRSEHTRLAHAVQASEERFRIWIEHANDMISVLTPEGIIKFESPSVSRILGYAADELVGECLFERVHPDDVDELQRTFAEVVENIGTVVTNQYRFRHKDGAWRALEVVRKCVRNGAQLEVVANGRDVTERQQIEDDLRLSQQRFRDFADSAADYLWETDAELKFTYASECFHESSGLTASSVIGRPRAEVFGLHPDPESWSEHLKEIEQRRPYSDFEIRTLRPDGSIKVFRDSGKPVFDSEGNFVGYRGAARDVTDSHVLSEKLSYQANHDMLTGLINRQHFDERLQRAIDSAASEHVEHVLCYLDLDQFKVVNDTCGHVAGDRLLQELSAILKDRIRGRDSVARLGGDEFGVILEHCSLEQGQRIVDTLHAAVESFRFSWEEAEFKIGVSIGVVAINAGNKSITDVLGAADSACYIAKERGRNRVHVYRDDDAELVRRHGEMQWAARVNRALDEDQFLLNYQPIVSLQDDHAGTAIDGEHFEVLLRLRDGDNHLVPAGEFLPAAEHYSLGTRIDKWVVRSTLDWLACHPSTLSNLHLCGINLSGHSLADETFPDFVIGQFKSSGVPAEKICFEITETAAIATLSAATRFMAQLKQMGCRFALDDFGSGLSSFAYLKTLPVDFLKIDGFFVKNIARNPIDRAMVKSIHEVGHVMGMKTIAEYADSDAVLQVLREIGVDYAQGFAVRESCPLPE